MTSDWYVLGVDLGSTTAKAVLLDADGRRAGSSVCQMGAVSREAARVATATALSRACIDESAIVRTFSTGYGRRLVHADRSFTEITCHARGASVLWPGVRLVIDIGGQDSKAITVDENGAVERFAMNDRCASGTGRFFDVLSRAIEVDIADIGELALRGTKDLEISSMCATFGETEVISLLARGEDKADIAASVHRAVAARTIGLVAQVGVRTPIVMTGGVATNAAAARSIAKALGHPVEVPDEPQLSGAYGAAILARDDYLAELRRGDAVPPDVIDTDHEIADLRNAQNCDTCATVAAPVLQIGRRVL